jgi:hypothetical protein
MRCKHEHTEGTIYWDAVEDFTDGERHRPPEALTVSFYRVECKDCGRIRQGKKINAAPTWVRRALGKDY